MNRRVAFGALLAPSSTGMVLARAPATIDGLKKIKVEYVDSVGRRPGVDGRATRHILVQPVSVSFSKSWNARAYGNFGLSSSEITKMRTGN